MISLPFPSHELDILKRALPYLLKSALPDHRHKLSRMVKTLITRVKEAARQTDRAAKNIKEGGGVSLKKVLNRRGGNFEFSSSNPMWRASLEILDFLPLNTVDYSGGMIVSDWYTGDSSNESIKISIRFLSNEVRSDSLKIIVHKKKCSGNQTCKIVYCVA